MADIRRRIRRKAKGLRGRRSGIAERRLHPILDPHDFKNMLPELCQSSAGIFV